jgi:hypothetical protein
MSYDILTVKENKEGEPVEKFSTQLILSALQEHPNVRKDEYGLWEYEDKGMGFAISFDEEKPSNSDIHIWFSYSSPEPALTYRLVAEFSLWLAEKLNATVYDPQLGKYITSKNTKEGVRRSLELFGRFERHALRRVQEGERIIIGPRRAVLESMYKQGAKSREKAGFKLWKFLLIIVLAVLIARLVYFLLTSRN